MSFLTADISAIHQQQSQLNSLQSASQQNVTTITNNSINDHTFTAIENGTHFEYQQLSNGKTLDLIGDEFLQRNSISVVNNNNLITANKGHHQISIPTTMNSHGGAAVVVESIPGTGNASGLPPTIAPAALNGGTITAQNMTTTQQGLGPNMVLVNAATGVPISSTGINSLSGTMTTQSNSASLPAGISVQQLLQQAQQQQAAQAQAQQVQQQITMPNSGGNLVSVALASPNTQTLQGGSGGPQTFTLSALPPSSVMSASGNPPGSTLVSLIQQPQGGMIQQQQQGASQPTTQQILEAGSGTGQFQFTTLNQLPIDLHQAGGAGSITNPGNAEESGVLLCNLDELSRYIPENFYSDFTISDQNNAANAVVTQASNSINSNRLPDYLETVVASAGKNQQQISQATQNLLNAQTQSLSQSTVLQAMKQEQLPASILQQPLPQMSTNTTTLQLPSSLYQRTSTHSGSTIITAPTSMMTSTQIAGTQPTASSQQKLTIQLPTQPQPIQGVKTVTYVSSIGQTQPQYQTITTNALGQSNLTPVKLTTTGFAYTSTGERIAIQGLQPETLSSWSGGTQGLQFQLKSPVMSHSSQHPIHANAHQTLQLQGLTVDPSKLTVLQELPEVGKVVVQETKPNTDSITTILEEMKGPTGYSHSDDGFSQFTTVSAGGGIEYATAIPVAVSSLGTDPKKMTIKKVAAPASTVLLPSGNRGTRNIIFAGNTLPQGAIPIQINGLNALPLSAVKSLPAKINLSALSPNGSVQMTSTPGGAQFHSQVVNAKKTKVEVINRPTLITSPTSQLTAGQHQIQLPANIITKIVTNNNATLAAQQHQQKFFTTANITTPVTTITSPSGSHVIQNEISQQRSPTGGLAQPSSKNVGNNKTCNWVFENGEVCAKTFSKSYNLVVHMRMHEDVRPFCCGLCDQTFRQKAHLQRHETTHGIGVKIGKGGGGGTPSARRKRKRSRSTGGGPTATAMAASQLGSATSSPTTSPAQSLNLQKRLAHVNEKFGNTASTVASTSGTIITTSSFASTSAVLNAVVGGGNNNTTTIITTTESEEDDDHILKVEPGNAVKNYSKKQKQTTTATVLTSANNITATTNATNMVGQILMTPTNVTQIDLGEKVMVTRATKLRQSMEASSNSDDQSIMDLEEVEDEVNKDDDKFTIIEPITTSSRS